MTETDNLSGTEFAGCRIMTKIGQGGMGSVYTARHLALDKTVAVKILSPELARDARNVEFFLREARSAAKLEHPNIVQIYNFGLENGSYFIVMSYIDGKSLADVVAEKGPLDAETATGIILEVLEGLGHAHSKTIIHRDIKPSNILLGADGHPKIVDFGLARSINEEKQLTIAGEMVGTAYFMSPEQGLAAKVDHRADLYSAGATYFYLLTARYPFEGKSSIEVIHKHIGEPFPNIIRLKPDLPLWISRVLEHLMRKKPEDRYQSAAQVIDEIKRLKTAELDGTAVSNERSIELPELSARLAARAEAAPAPPPPPPPPPPEFKPFQPSEAPLSSDHTPPAPPRLSVNRKETPSGKELQLPKLHNAIKTARHASVTLAAMGFFLLAGSTGTPKSKIPASLLSPFSSGTAAAWIFTAAGLSLAVWSVFLKPLKLTPMHFLFSAASALAAYAGAVYAPSPESTDLVSKAFFCLKLAAENIASPASLPAYSLALFLAASKSAFKPHWAAKTGASAAYGLSLLLTYTYFRNGLAVQPETTYLALAAAASLSGLAAAFIQRRGALLFNPPVLFLAANVFIFAMFSGPQIAALTEARLARETPRVEELNREAYRAYRLALTEREAAVPEFDTDGRPIEKKPVVKPAAALPATREELGRAAKAEHLELLASRLRSDLLNASGLIFLALFMLLMANIYFVEETMSYYGERDAAQE